MNQCVGECTQVICYGNIYIFLNLLRDCFQEYFTHKFRATIGKNKLFDADDVVLVPFSGSESSVAMLNLMIEVGFNSHLIEFYLRLFYN